MRAASAHHDRKRLDVQMTPMIDVIFLLLIFFVVTADFTPAAPPEQILPTHLTLPGGIESDVRPEDTQVDLTVIVELRWEDDKPIWRISGQQFDKLNDVHATLAQIATSVAADTPVILDIDEVVPMEHVIDLYDTSRSVGLVNVQFAASPESMAEAAP